MEKLKIDKRRGKGEASKEEEDEPPHSSSKTPAKIKLLLQKFKFSVQNIGNQMKPDNYEFQ